MHRGGPRILFIEPPFYRLSSNASSLDRYPLGLGYLAGAVRRATDWRVLVHNADFHPGSTPINLRDLTTTGFVNYRRTLADRSAPVWREVAATIARYRPTVVAMSVKAPLHASARIVAQIAKDVDRNILVVAGGPHVTLAADAVLACPQIDLGVCGEGEQTIVELVTAIEKGRDPRAIDGLVHRSSGRIVHNTPRALIEDLDSTGFPAEFAPEVLKDYALYPKSAFGFVVASRGCPYACVFCGSRHTWTRRVRHRSARHVADEINNLRRAGVRSVHFDDDTFGADKARLTDLCTTLMAESPGLRWSCELHARVVDAGTIALMKQAGCCRIQMGVESGSDEILRTMRKEITLRDAFAAASVIKAQGLELELFFMVGFPTETEDTLRETVAAMHAMPCDGWVYSIFTPYPGTEAFDSCTAAGLIGADYDVSLHHHQSPANAFCLRLEPDRFRALVSDIERMVDARNARRSLEHAFSLETVLRVRERGVLRALKRGAGLLTDRDFWAGLRWRRSEEPARGAGCTSGGAGVRP
jgi:anaerobic magnesium-protoporphyrin IX monomethyl ester cyclase